MRVIVIGGGISGLACAFRLRQASTPFLLLEQSPRVGGLIETLEQDGFRIEVGPQSFLSTEPLLELIASLGLESELLRADPRAPRYVLVRGRLRPAPMSPPSLLFTSLLGWRTKWRLLSEAFRRSQPPEKEESIAEFVRRKFGTELLDYLLGPFVSGVYAGDPEKLSLRSAFPFAYQWEKDFGSVLRGAMKSRPPKGTPRPALCSFTAGLATLVRTLGKKLDGEVRRSARVHSLTHAEAAGRSRFEVEVAFEGRTETLSAEVLILATPARVTAELLAKAFPALAHPLEMIETAPVAVVAAGYRREQVSHPLEGFGFLVPRKESLRVLGTVWNSSLFPGRAPKGTVLLTSFTGGATDPEVCQWSEERIGKTIHDELRQILNIHGPPTRRIVYRHAEALPQYNLGHARTMEVVRALCANVPGLFLTGNYLEGVSIGACVEQAFRTAESVGKYIRTAEGAELHNELPRNAVWDRP